MSMFKGKAKSAFGLIECMIYLIVFIIIVHILIVSVAGIYKKNRSTNVAIHSILQLYSASDKLVDDMHQALADTIRVENSDSISFYVNAFEHIRWYLKKSSLIRSSRIYDVKKRKWSKSSASTAAQQVDAMYIQLVQKHNKVKAVMVQLASPYCLHIYSLYVCLFPERL